MHLKLQLTPWGATPPIDTTPEQDVRIVMSLIISFWATLSYSYAIKTLFLKK